MKNRPETLYGEQKRLRFMTNALTLLAAQQPIRVLEIGCGTGLGLLVPLAERFKRQIEFTGLDADPASIAAGQRFLAAHPDLSVRLRVANAMGLHPDFMAKDWDVVILSEVIEHVEDPTEILAAANRALKNQGLLLVTVPNGYGPYEVERFFWDAFGLDGLLRAGRRWFGRGGSASQSTMAEDNRHVGFYRWRDITHLLDKTGFRIQQVENREWFSGPFSDMAHAVLRRIGLGWALISFSVSMGSLVPRSVATDWMVVAIKERSPDPRFQFHPPSGGFRGWWWKIKRSQSARLP